MVQIGSKWLKMARISSKKVKIGSNWYKKTLKMAQKDLEKFKIVQEDSEQLIMDQNGSKWFKKTL